MALPSGVRGDAGRAGGWLGGGELVRSRHQPLLPGRVNVTHVEARLVVRQQARSYLFSSADAEVLPRVMPPPSEASLPVAHHPASEDGGDLRFSKAPLCPSAQVGGDCRHRHPRGCARPFAGDSAAPQKRG